MRLLLLGLAFIAGPLTAQISVQIFDRPPVTLTPADLAGLPRHTTVMNEHGKPGNYEGPLLRDVLTKAGYDFGKGIHGAQVAGYVRAHASDGYETLFSIAECDPATTEADVILADKHDGQALGPNEGPYRIVAPHDKRPVRSARMVTQLYAVELKTGAKPASTGNEHSHF